MRFQAKLLILTVLSFFSLLSNDLLHAAPSISSVDSSQLSQGIVTVNGSGFGAGAKIEVYDDFEHIGVATGDTLKIDQALVGQWSDSPYYKAIYDNFSLSGKHSAKLWDSANSVNAQIRHTFSSPIQSVYMSYWVAIPPGYPFPGNDNDYGGFSKDSSWKLAWLIDQDYKGNSSDVCVPTHVGQGRAMLAGNDWNLDGGIPDFPSWWSFGNWIRVSVWLHAEPTSPTTSGEIAFSTWSKEFGHSVYRRNQAVFDADGTTTKQYQYINFPGWIRGFMNNNGRPLYDDIYVASGPNAFARVELTDSTNYTNSTKFAVQKVLSWSDNQIKFQIVKSNIIDITNSAVHVFSGDASSTSIGTVIGASATASPPNPPALNVNVSAN